MSVTLFTRDFNLISASYFALYTSFYFLLSTISIYAQSIGGQEWQIGVVAASFAVSSIVSRLLLGREVDRRGKRKILLLGLLVFLASMIMYNYSTSIPLLLLVRTLHGVGWAATTTTLSALAADVSPAQRRGEALGYFGMFGNFAIAFGPALGVAIMTNANFSTLFFSASAIAFISLLIASQIHECARAQQASPKVLGKILNRNALSPTTVILLITFSYGSVVTYLPLYAQEQSISNVGLFFTVYAASVILLRPVAGRLSDRHGRAAIILPGIVLVVAGVLIISLPYQLLLFLLSAIIYGAGFGAAYPTLMALAVDLVSPEERGSAMGTFISGFDLGIALGSVVLGFILQFAGFKVMFLSAAAVSALSIPLILRRERRRKKSRESTLSGA